MKITKRYLQKLIKEEISALIKEEGTITSDGERSAHPILEAPPSEEEVERITGAASAINALANDLAGGTDLQDAEPGSRGEVATLLSTIASQLYDKLGMGHMHRTINH